MITTISRKTRIRSGLAGKNIDPRSEAAELYLYNQQSSPLLQLPRELRNIIYSHVLGGNKTIYITYRPHEWSRRKINKNSSKLIHTVKGGFHCSVYPPKTNPFINNNNNASIFHRQNHNLKIEEGFTLLSRVCRQLYIETATTAMKENTWAFANRYVMNRCLVKERRFSLAQRRALRAVMVASPETLTKTIVAHLGGLQTVLVQGKVVRTLDPREFGRSAVVTID